MSRIRNFISSMVYNLKTTVIRFPLTIVFLASLSTVMFLIIEDYSSLDIDLLSRYMFAGIFGALLATAVRFMLERFEGLKNSFLFYGLTILLTAGYYYFLTNDEFSNKMFIHLLVISFALFAAYLFLPSSKNAVNFGNVALAHFKASFTSLLYGIVLYIGIAAIIGAIDILLYDIDYKSYAHAANIIFIFFTPLYYLSLLPKFNSTDKNDDAKKEISFIYPKFLDILVSYITIPLITAFTAVLIIYFIKILASGVWPVGQVGPMVLGYSAAGYFIYILSSNLNNKFSVLYRKLFPLVLIPLVVMQMVSSYIRIDAYGITESRYYVVLFGIFSIVCALVLIFTKKKNSNTIVLLSAIFALISIIPPVDAFTVSKNSQERRLTEILNRNNMIVDGEIVKRADISTDDMYEITNISNYMQGMGYLDDMDWFPDKYADNYYGNFRNIYGFEQYYDTGYPGREETLYLNAMLNENEKINIENYDMFFKTYIHNKREPDAELGEFTLKGKNYAIKQIFDEKGYITITVSDDSNTLIEIPMKEFIDGLFEKANEPKGLMDQETLTIETQNDELKVKLLINDINVDKSDPEDIYIYANIYVFVAVQ
ncbi:MAG: DUF4153 domain-containing protein [Tissierellia bacterium]|nr:DUF4153 domain-containing protein [Tissierellia bacterium]MDD3226335.1 DUF4153 domain-containing protein [Tissierellia bacterium]MDD3750566.1 DUF4153 domain-containing protein [Tissierellia bacterium]MDD4045678.1 DUF4153 domain-containing protein [Tissierellia bacterium]MDD4677719.1 DUF4153 domain-containing protein [Tissierellia bacterium]